jgi:hypothetical protein
MSIFICIIAWFQWNKDMSGQDVDMNEVDPTSTLHCSLQELFLPNQDLAVSLFDFG